MVSDIVRELKKAQSIGVITHINPDGDAVGSVLAIALALKKLKKSAVVIKNDIIPDKYKFLPGQELITCIDDITAALDILIVLDCGDADRLGNGICLLEKAKTVINIDHHISNTMFGNLNLVDTNAAATAEIVYQVIKLTGARLDMDIATCLYTAIVADTGCFRYDNTTQVTHTICGELISLGVKSNRIITRLFHERTLPQLKILGMAVNSLKIFHGGKTAVMMVTKDMMEDSGAAQGDLENVIDFGRDVSGVEIAVLMKEVEDNSVRIGFRAKDDVDVSSIARGFGGGGHKKASGCTLKGSLSEALEMVLGEIDKIFGVRQ